VPFSHFTLTAPPRNERTYDPLTPILSSGDERADYETQRKDRDGTLPVGEY
jgi:hypothetical protein